MLGHGGLGGGDGHGFGQRDPAAHHYGDPGGGPAVFGRAAADGVRNESRDFGGGQVRDLGADGYRHYVGMAAPRRGLRGPRR